VDGTGVRMTLVISTYFFCRVSVNMHAPTGPIDEDTGGVPTLIVRVVPNEFDVPVGQDPNVVWGM
jgi:hypothetical protein